ncbi:MULTISPECIES: RagB/SusD family nutrient uptake outer membrane protein [Butyricimonas]|uniref:RagB/SusD family nutrient uptake outer membrane protein n=1 Tax=Butyricimonas TaxID=574697 RepID=UPI001D082863|nr:MULTISPECIES: RagB/SusD family nutrient uptake outer membrane protein [Butyricimonas]MCB6971973.1 RagB/SusD family nutrient uptake outer membrane protein [Butyricimonas synergistica]MCG4518981.1 RagB/SusD family nutrient uptake outer membrane protein [Butyricimonas sp. DFI.6.44]
MKIGIYILPLVCLFVACSDFLDYKDNDKIIPSELIEYNELIYGELIDKSSSSTCYNLLIMSDDVGSWVKGNSSDERIRYKNWYSWAKETQITPDGDEMIDPAWEFLYHKILMCNVIENDVSVIEDDLEGVKYRLLGEVQAIRAMSYWYLVNMYGEPYRSAEQAKTAMGVPVNKEISILDKIYERESLSTIYELIEENLKSALVNLGKGEQKNTIFRPNKDIVRLFLSRIYLEQKRYGDVITVCNDLLEETNKSILPLEKMTGNNYSNEHPVISRDGGNLLFSWWNRDAVSGFNSNSYSIGKYCVSPDLKNMIKQNPDDVRGNSYVYWDYDGAVLYKFSESNSKCYRMCYRIEEAYFNRAEAYIYTDQRDLAMQDLTQVYKQRVKGEEPKLEASVDEAAIEILRNEKRKEFCFEDIRWFDIRRWGLPVEHQYQDINDENEYQTFVLEAESPNYILPLPLDIQRRNEKIEQVVRVETIVKK